MTDTSLTTNAAASTADEPSAENQTSTSGAPAQPSETENAGSKANAGAPVSQALFDRLHHDYQVVLAALKAVKAELEEAKAHADKLEQLADQVAEEVAKEAKPAAAVVYANAEEEIAALKPRLHDLVAEAKAVSDRLGDLVPRNHPALNVMPLVHALMQKVRVYI